MVGLFAGVVAAFIFDSVSDRVRGVLQIERELRLPVLTHASSVSSDLSKSTNNQTVRRDLCRWFLPHLPSKAAEEIRSVAQLGGACRRYQEVCLWRAGTRKRAHFRYQLTWRSCWLKPAYEFFSWIPILISLRAHDEFGINNGPGLGEYLAGHLSTLTPIRPVERLENFFMVTGGHAPSSSSELLSSSLLRSVLMAWKEEFDYVVLIGTPLLATNAGVLLASSGRCHGAFGAKWSIANGGVEENLRSLLRVFAPEFMEWC